MKLSLDKFLKSPYFQKNGKITDQWSEVISILPIGTNKSVICYDKTCSLLSTVGVYFREACGDNRGEINSISCIRESLISFLKEERGLDEEETQTFVNILQDIFNQNDTFAVPNSEFIKYYPVLPSSKAYRAGHQKLADYLYSMQGDSNTDGEPHGNSKDIFTQTLKDAFDRMGKAIKSPRKRPQYIIPKCVKRTFYHDFHWLMTQNDEAVVRYLPLLFYFYICISLFQTVASILKGESLLLKDQPDIMYVVLDSERVSINHDAIQQWAKYMSSAKLEKLFGRIQSLDILNLLLANDDEVIGFEQEIEEKLCETPFDVYKEEMESILKTYKEEKLNTLDRRKYEKGDRDIPSDLSVSTYREFIDTLQRLCIGLTPKEYKGRIKKHLNDIFKIRLLQTRRGNEVPVLDNEMLIFLISLVTKGRRTKLQEVYNGFHSYGIYFNRETRLAIENHLFQMNLLERKSDSGEAQFVHISI